MNASPNLQSKVFFNPQGLENCEKWPRGYRAIFCLLLYLFVFILSISIVCADTLPKTQPPDNSNLPVVETWRIRIQNSDQGPIEFSIDSGKSWLLIGRVNTPATKSLEGYLAAGYAPIGTVAATAVHGIRIRLGGVLSAYPNLINILPREFAATPNYFGGHIAGDSGIYTNIPAGTSLFREVSPYVGSPVYLQSANDSLQPLTSAYVPTIGDTLVIRSLRRQNELKSITIENRPHGDVRAYFADGTSELVCHVVSPVLGVGRFDGTSYTGVGAVNTNHTCVITISTAPVATTTQLEGDGDERRGGFQIEPYYHNSNTEEAGAPQVLIIGDDHAQSPTLEGREPLFFGGINLAWSPNDPAHSWVCDVRTSQTGDRWQPMPEMIGNQPSIIKALGITAFRLHRDIGDSDLSWLKSLSLKIAENYREYRANMAAIGRLTLVRGRYSTAPSADDSSVKMVEYYIDGGLLGITNSQPFGFTWDSRRVPDGEHVIERRLEAADGSVIKDQHLAVYVDNSHKIKSAG